MSRIRRFAFPIIMAVTFAGGVVVGHRSPVMVEIEAAPPEKPDNLTEADIDAPDEIRLADDDGLVGAWVNVSSKFQIHWVNGPNTALTVTPFNPGSKKAFVYISGAGDWPQWVGVYVTSEDQASPVRWIKVRRD